jgi:hypothetical protein
MRMILPLVVMVSFLAGCGGTANTADDADPTVSETDRGSTFLEREKRRSEENDANREKALQDIYGVAPDDADSDQDNGAD